MKLEITEEKLRKLKPVIESILSKKYGKKITFTDLTYCGVSIKDK